MYFSFIGIVVVNDIKIGMPPKKINLKKSVEKKKYGRNGQFFPSLPNSPMGMYATEKNILRDVSYKKKTYMAIIPERFDSFRVRFH